MYYADREYGLISLIRDKQYKIGIEIGVRHGSYSKLILQYTGVEKLYLLDCFPYPDMLPSVMSNLSVFMDRIEIIQGYSPQESSKFNDNFFDFIYIDANHTYEKVKLDLNAWWPKLKVGGLFAGDDYTYLTNPGEGKYGVVEAVDEFAFEQNQDMFVTGIHNYSLEEKHRIARGTGRIIEAGLKNQINIKFGTSSSEDDIRIPNWYCIKK